jgi:hypothetical protein
LSTYSGSQTSLQEFSPNIQGNLHPWGEFLGRILGGNSLREFLEEIFGENSWREFLEGILGGNSQMVFVSHLF